MTNYNTTQLNVDQVLEKHVFHRDQFAHYLRWTHILKNARIGMNVLDVGCGTGNLLEVLYRNRYKGKEYLGIDVKSSAIRNAITRLPLVEWANFKVLDAVNTTENLQPADGMWDMVVCFELLEHVGKENVPKVLQNLHKWMSPQTTLYLSTPVHDPCVGAAANHMINGKVGELTYNELETLLKENNFIIEKVFGTFASISDYEYLLNSWQREMYNTLREYYCVDLLANFMAPFFPKQSRNCLWRCKKNGA